MLFSYVERPEELFVQNSFRKAAVFEFSSHRPLEKSVRDAGDCCDRPRITKAVECLVGLL